MKNKFYSSKCVLKFAWEPKSRSWRFFLSRSVESANEACPMKFMDWNVAVEALDVDTGVSLNTFFIHTGIHKCHNDITCHIASHLFFCAYPLFICTLHCMISIDCYWTQPINQLLKSIYGDQQQQQEKLWARNKALTATTGLTSTTTKNEYIIFIAWRRHSISCFFSF